MEQSYKPKPTTYPPPPEDMSDPTSGSFHKFWIVVNYSLDVKALKKSGHLEKEFMPLEE